MRNFNCKSYSKINVVRVRGGGKMAKEKEKTFEESLVELEEIVQRLECGDVPLEEALTAFQEGMALSKQCQDTLEKAEKTLTKIMTENNKEIPFEEESN